MKRYYTIFIPLSMCMMATSVMAQTLSTDAPAGQKTWEIVLKLAFPILMTAVGPYVTGYIKHAHPAAKYIVASLASMLIGVGAGAIPDFPLTMESAATIGATSGATGQFLFLQHPKSPQ